MNEEIKQKIIDFNNKFGIQTEFIKDEDVLGYALKNKIYINENAENDYEKINKHELLHFFEDTSEFIEMKKYILEKMKDKIDILRTDYELRYFGLYSKEEIEFGAIDNEIVIDIMTNNLDFEYENGLKVGDIFLGKIEKSIEEKRYLNLSLKANIKNLNLSDWEKIFVANYYDGNERKFPQGKDKISGIKEDINKYLEELYNKNEDDMKINRHSPEVIREFESQIKALRARGADINNIQYFKNNFEDGYEKIANKSEKHLYKEYKHIVDILKSLDYEPAFKAMMLNETLTKIYKIDIENGKEKTIIKKRDLNSSIAGHMIFNKQTLDFMYKNVNYIDQYDKNFANLYFASIEVYKNIVAEKSSIVIEGVETYDKGKWKKFAGKTTDENNYLENAENLATLVQNTPWCTKQLASSQLAEGDFYVFVDKDNNPHIAVKMNGNSIDEVRGIQNGNAQELEEEYRDVALSFLENNKEIENGKEWFEKEEWNKRLIDYKNKIENETLQKEDVPGMLEDLRRQDYKSHSIENSNRVELKKIINKAKSLIASYYECEEEEIYIGDRLLFSGLDVEVNPYKVIFGSVDFGASKVKDIGKLKVIFGDADFSFSKFKSLKELEYIDGYVDFQGSEIEDLGCLKNISGDAWFSDSKIKKLGELENIGRDAFFNKSEIEDLGKLKNIGRDAMFSLSKIRSLGELESIGRDAYFTDSEIEDLGMLKSIEGYAYFKDTKIQDFGELENIGKEAYFNDSGVNRINNNIETDGVSGLNVAKKIKSIARMVKDVMLSDIKKAKNVLKEIIKEEKER